MSSNRLLTVLALLLSLLTLLCPAPVWAATQTNSGIHHPISTRFPAAQQAFDRGLMLTYGFNHPEALRSFEAAAAIDPDCAMCYWGMAYVLGPNINAAMEDTAITPAWKAIQQAVVLSDSASSPERALIEALADRYSPSVDSPEERAVHNLAYANAMRQVAQKYPDDLDAATLFAEALMDTTPWNYWQDNGDPTPVGAEIVSTLESVLEREPNHLGALHYYIHAVEKKHPDRAVAVADRLARYASAAARCDRLRNLHPVTGHLVHMPTHIYLRVGRYEDAVQSNQDAIAIDRIYAQKHPEANIYALAYMPHNPHFLWFAATLAGQQTVALEAANQTAAMVDPTLMRQAGYGTLQHYRSIPLYSMVKFGLWDKILAEPSPEADLHYPTGVWHYARGMAFTALHQPQQAAIELQKLKTIAADPALDGVTIWDINKTADLLQIASDVLTGELFASQGQYEAAIASLRSAVEREDSLSYDEPAPWHSPTRQSLAAVLLKSGDPAAAEQVYRDDLAMYPNNGWSLHGLAQSLKVQNKSLEAAAIQQQFEAAWQQANFTFEDA